MSFLFLSYYAYLKSILFKIGKNNIIFYTLFFSIYFHNNKNMLYYHIINKGYTHEEKITASGCFRIVI